MKQYSKNPRKITKKQLEQLKANIEELGDLSGIVHDLNSDEIISGNQRSKIIDINSCNIVITEKYDEPTKQGTVAWGFVEWDSQKLSYRQVRWNEEQRKKACVTANALGGDWDYDVIRESFKDDRKLFKDWGIDDKDLLKAFTGEEKSKDENYSTKVESLIYTPKKEKPTFEEMVDISKYKELVREIEKSNVSDEEKEFLKIAATRHIVFNYEEIANYYANSDKNMQELMENSALVIIDYNKAVELGYVQFVKDIQDEYAQEYKIAR